MGASGAGKTTLLNILGGLERPVAGRVYVTGVDLVKLNANQLAKLRNGKIGFVYQFPLSLNGVYGVGECGNSSAAARCSNISCT